MPIQVDHPTGLGARDDWGLEGAASKLLAVAGDDGDSSIIYADSGGAEHLQLFTFPVLVGVADPVTAASISVRVRAYNNGVGGQYFWFWFNGAKDATNHATDIRAVQPAYTTRTHSAAGGSLALAAVNGQHGFSMQAAGGPSQQWEVWLTEVSRSVTYVYGSSADNNFAHLIGGLVGAIGANLLFREMPALARAIYRKTGVLITPEEYLQALQAWRRERHVRVFA
jgi:hypothetical protein